MLHREPTIFPPFEVWVELKSQQAWKTQSLPESIPVHCDRKKFRGDLDDDETSLV